MPERERGFVVHVDPERVELLQGRGVLVVPREPLGARQSVLDVGAGKNRQERRRGDERRLFVEMWGSGHG